MKLDPDCIRDILLEIENTCSYHKIFSYPCNSEFLDKYDEDVVMYHVRQCHLSGLLHKTSFYLGGGCSVMDLTPEGHKFLADIRSDTNWNRTKDIAKSVGSMSLNAITDISAKVIAQLISKQMGLS